MKWVGPPCILSKITLQIGSVGDAVLVLALLLAGCAPGAPGSTLSGRSLRHHHHHHGAAAVR